ncbi:MAG: hypothetical protein WA624_09815 [Methylocella sp.]
MSGPRPTQQSRRRFNAHAPPHAITGVLEHADGPVLTLRTRAGTLARVDDSDAVRTKQIGVLAQGDAYTVEGTYYDSTGALRAQTVARAKASPAIWPPDNKDLARGGTLLALGILNEGRHKARDHRPSSMPFASPSTGNRDRQRPENGRVSNYRDRA